MPSTAPGRRADGPSLWPARWQGCAVVHVVVSSFEEHGSERLRLSKSSAVKESRRKYISLVIAAIVCYNSSWSFTLPATVQWPRLPAPEFRGRPSSWAGQPSPGQQAADAAPNSGTAWFHPGATFDEGRAFGDHGTVLVKDYKYVRKLSPPFLSDCSFRDLIFRRGR